MCSCLVCAPRKEACTQARFFHFFSKATLANVVEAALYYCCWEHNKEVMLDTFITSRVRRKIIVVYAKYPDFKTHVRGLAKLIKEDAGRQGNTKIYYTNKQFPIFKELQSIVLKSQRVAAQKRQQRV
jgi:hypothetical protein